MKACFQIAECSLSSAKIVQASAMKACFQKVEFLYIKKMELSSRVAPFVFLITKNPRLGSKVYVCKYSLFICEKYKTFIL